MRIFYHEYNEYSYVIQEENGSMHVERLSGNVRSANLKIIPDVPDDEKMWAYYKGEMKKQLDSSVFIVRYIEIHVHSEKDINGGGWNHGKFGSGTTSVIE